MTRSGHLMDATRLIQEALSDSVASAAPPAWANPSTARAANDDAPPADDNVIDVHIGRLRKKIDRPGMRPIIHTVRGVGFLLSDRHEP